MQIDAGEISRKYPLMASNLLSLPDGLLWIERIAELEGRWRKIESSPNDFEVAYTEGIPSPAPPIEGEFEVAYAGGTLGLFHAALMAKKYGRKVLVFDAHRVGKTHRDWNISDPELQEFTIAGLFSSDEIGAAIVNRYEKGFIKFFDEGSKVKTPPLFLKNVLDVSIDADRLLGIARRKAEESGSLVKDGLIFRHAYLLPERVIIECEEKESKSKLFFSAKLFIDATGTNSPVSRQMNSGRSITHVCPTVGTLASGFERGNGDKQANFSIGEILATTENSMAGRQLIWEGFAGDPEKDEYTTYLFFYDSLDSPADRSLFALFEEYFKKLPDYKSKGSDWKVIKPVFGYIPSFHHHSWKNQKRTAAERILLIGDAAGLSSPLTFCGFGSHVRNLRRLAAETEAALRDDCFSEKRLSLINAYEARVSQMASLAEFMRPAPGSDPCEVNETMNAVMQALSELEPEIGRELFQDRVSFASMKKMLAKTASIYPKVFRLMLSHLGAKGSFWWVANIAKAAFLERKSK